MKKTLFLAILFVGFCSGCTTVSVRDADTGKGLAGARIYYEHSSPRLPAKMVTDWFGNYSFSGIAFYAPVLVEADGYESSAEVLGGEVGRFTVNLHKSGPTSHPK